MPAKHSALVLCTGNSCRSILAEALILHLSRGRVAAWSAGSHPTGVVHPLALQVLSSHGIPCPEPRSKSVDEFSGSHFDFVLTVCDSARDECPVFLGANKRIHWSLQDPAKGSLEDFERCYQQLHTLIAAWISTL
jgi:arsenate reductase